jgi:Na+/H+-dicarboxylate symporter
MSVLVGIGLAFILRSYANLTNPEKLYFGFPGEIFLRMLKFLILPLITSSLISGIFISVYRMDNYETTFQHHLRDRWFGHG